MKSVFVLGSCLGIADCDIVPFASESDLLFHWSRFVQAVDPDIILGYNILNFDIPYLIHRAEALKLTLFPYLGRRRNEVTACKDVVRKGLGSNEITASGRVFFDMLPIIRKDFKLSSYSLNSVSFEFLGEQKEDVHHSIISELQAGNEETRRRLASYCLKDSILPLKLMEKMSTLINLVEMANVSGVPMNFLLTRGEGIKVLAQIYRKAITRGFITPNLSKGFGESEKFQGAVVIDPKKGFYKDPIVTLDFMSLYPSIMIAHNLCYTTIIPQDVREEDLDNVEYSRTPTGVRFVKKDVRIGVLPEILQELLDARKKVKREMAAEKDPFRKGVLNARQLAIKVSANSVYGFTGATVGPLPCVEISSAVTSYGREMIILTKKLVEAKYTKENGYIDDAEVVY